MKKGTYMKIAAGVLVVLLVWWFLRMRSGRRHKVIVSQMPATPMPLQVVGDEGDDLYTTVPPMLSASPSVAPKESYAEWEPEGYDEFSDVQFKQDLLE